MTLGKSPRSGLEDPEIDRTGRSANSKRLNVRLFGELDLRLGDERLPPLDSARARSLLAYLFLNDRAPQSRQRLAFMLWPDSTEGQARTNLRHLLHTLRRVSPQLDRFLDVTAQMFRWRPEAAYWVDVSAFEAALARADATGIGPDGVLAELREAVSYYTGDLLDGCYDEWLIETRERLRDRHIAALQRLTNLLADRGEHAEAIRLGRELLRSDALNEETYRLLIRIHDAVDDRAGAVRVYHECVSTLQRELGVEPSAATMEAYARSMRSEHRSTVAKPERGRGAAKLVGREPEWDQLTKCWIDAEGGRAGLVLVTGEPGVGKSRVVEELAAWCVRRGALVGQARSYPTEGELGYGVVISWLRTAEVASQLRASYPSDMAELSRLLPELDDGPETAAPPTVDEADKRRRLFDAVARTLTASGRPTLLVADDAQWCDAQSLQVIHYLLRLKSTNPLLVVGTVRREELDDDHPVGALVGEPEMLDRTTEIALDRLTRDETEELALDLAGGAFDQTNVDALYAETEGNPLFIVETMNAGWDAARRGGLSPKLQAVIGARLRRLSKDARDVLEMAATVGREFAVDSLAGASGIADIPFVRGLDELWRRGILREHGINAYDFSHGKIRDVAYEALSPATRRRNHLLIAEALVKLHKRDPDAVSGEVARHYDGAGRVDDAVAWYRRAAVQAQRLHANIEAVQLLDRARVIIGALPEGVGRLKLELEIVSALAIPLAVAEGFASARLAQTQRRAVELAATLGVDAEPSLLRSLAMSGLCRKDFGAAGAVAERLRRLGAQDGDDVLLIESEYLSGIAAFWDGRFQTARLHLERGVNQFTPERRLQHLARFGHDPSIVCLSRLANTLWFLGHPNDARRACRDALAMAKEVAHPFSRGVAHVFAALLSIDLGETAHFREYVDVLTADFEDHAWHWIASGAFHGYADVLEGRADEGIGRIRRMIDTHDSIDQAPGQHAMVMRVLVAAYEAADDANGGLRAAEEALLLDGTRIWEAEVRRLRAKFSAAHGAPAVELEAELGRAADVARRQGAVGLERRIERTRSDLLGRT